MEKTSSQSNQEWATWYFREYDRLKKLQGVIHEVSASNIIGGDAVFLDEIAKTAKQEGFKGYPGGSFPTYDISSSSEITSVKSHLSGGDKITEQDIQAYLREFNEMLGHRVSNDKGIAPIQQDAKRIIYLRDLGVPVPTEINNASQQEVVDYLRHKSIMRIPDDHVEAVKQRLYEIVQKDPEKYFLPSNPTNEQIESVTERIQQSGKSSAQTIEEIKNSPQGIEPPTETDKSEIVPLIRRKNSPESSPEYEPTPEIQSIATQTTSNTISSSSLSSSQNMSDQESQDMRKEVEQQDKQQLQELRENLQKIRRKSEEQPLEEHSEEQDEGLFRGQG
jgi:hypothetical protein